MKEILAIIPARGGSKGILRKNLRLLAGEPLLAHTIVQACRSEFVNRVVVSTDDPEIAAIAGQYRAEVVCRPAEISGDSASSESALRHALDHLGETEGYRPDLVVFLQCTSPIRRTNDIDRAVLTLLDDAADSLLSVVPAHIWVWHRIDGQPQSLDYDYRRRPRRQDRPPEYLENGSIYIFKPWVLSRFDNRLGGKIALYEMDEWSKIDIETPTDLELCEWIMSRLPDFNRETIIQ